MFYAETLYLFNHQYHHIARKVELYKVNAKLEGFLDEIKLVFFNPDIMLNFQYNVNVAVICWTLSSPVVYNIVTSSCYSSDMLGYCP